VGIFKTIGKLTSKDTAANVKNAIARVLAAEAAKGLAGILIGVAATALILSTVHTNQNTKALEERAE
jgi:hypothetical protein